jgi:hypothetical protein
MKKLALIFAALAPAVALAQPPHDEPEGRYIGPVKEDVEILEVTETPPVGSSHSLQVKVKNNSKYYLDRVAIQCNVTNKQGFRVFKDMVFKSAPTFSIKIAFPPITTPEIGIPSGAVADIGLYTTDNRWFRGFGEYSYDCWMYGVAGSE